jgi:hypothetical protein
MPSLLPARGACDTTNGRSCPRFETTWVPICRRRCLTLMIEEPFTMRYVLRFIFVVIVITLAWNWLQRP